MYLVSVIQYIIEIDVFFKSSTIARQTDRRMNILMAVFILICEANKTRYMNNILQTHQTLGGDGAPGPGARTQRRLGGRRGEGVSSGIKAEDARVFR